MFIYVLLDMFIHVSLDVFLHVPLASLDVHVPLDILWDDIAAMPHKTC